MLILMVNSMMLSALPKEEQNFAETVESPPEHPAEIENRQLRAELASVKRERDSYLAALLALRRQ